MNTNPKSSTKTVQHIASAAYSSTQTPSAGVDVEGFEFLEVIVPVGAVAAAATFDIKLQQSSASDGSGDAFADITGAAFTQIANGNTGVMRLGELRVGGSIVKKYVRALATYGGSGTAVVGVIFKLHGPRASRKCSDTYDFQKYVSGNA